MNKIEELRKQLNILEAKEDVLHKQRLTNQKEIAHIESLIKDEERKIAGDTILPLVGKYVKWISSQPKAHGYKIFKYIHIDNITEKHEYDNEYIITGQLVEFFRNDSNEFVCYTYDKDYQGEINLDWNDPERNYFKVEDLTEISEDEFNLAKDMIKIIL